MRKYLLGLIAIGLALFFSSFTLVEQKGNNSYATYEFHGDSESEYLDASKWDLVIIVTISCEGNEEIACVVIVDITVSGVTNEEELVAHLELYGFGSPSVSISVQKERK